MAPSAMSRNARLCVFNRSTPVRGQPRSRQPRDVRRERPLLLPPPTAASSETVVWSDTSRRTGDVQSTFAGLEKIVKDLFSGSGRGDWEEIEGCWVVKPAEGIQPQAVVHFLGEAFVGAAPQIVYRSLLEALAEKGVVVIATPYSTTFDHLRSADEAQFKFDNAMAALGFEGKLPVYGIGHSLGALIHTLISSRYSVERKGNAFLSYNNRPATEVIPLLSQLSPTARLFGPLLSQLSASPFRPSAELVQDALKSLSPSIVRQVVPLVEQFGPMYVDAAQGREEFSPSPQELRDRVKSFYGVRRNLLLKFTDDGIDETDQLASMLQASGVGSTLDMTTRTLPGQHTRPMTQSLTDLPQPVASFANRSFRNGGKLIEDLSHSLAAGDGASLPELDRLSKSVSGMATLFGTENGGPTASSLSGLVDELTSWMGVAKKESEVTPTSN